VDTKALTFALTRNVTTDGAAEVEVGLEATTTTIIITLLRSVEVDAETTTDAASTGPASGNVVGILGCLPIVGSRAAVAQEMTVAAIRTHDAPLGHRKASANLIRLGCLPVAR